MSGMHACPLPFWKSLGLAVVVILSIIGCAKAPQVPQAAGGPQLTALTDCIARTQRTVDAAMSAGASAGEMGPTSTGLADARDAADDAQKLLQAGKPQEANERLTKALEDCQKLDTQAVQARDAALARQAQARARLRAEQRLQQVNPCLAAAQQSILAADAAGAAAGDLAGARRALTSSESTVREAQQQLARGNAVQALSYLDAAQSDCLSARDQANQARSAAVPRR